MEWQTIYTLIRLLLKEQSDLGLHFLHMPFCEKCFRTFTVFIGIGTLLMLHCRQRFIISVKNTEGNTADIAEYKMIYSDFHDFVCSLFPKAILFDFYFFAIM